jgi:predicted ATP-binding protein involved in virulence
MRIQRFATRKMHGYLSFELIFQHRLTLLTGINGAGKTSALRSIMSLLLPSLRSLVETDFAEMSVSVNENGTERTVSAHRSATDIRLSCTGIGDSLTIPLLKRDRFEPSNRFTLRQREFFREIEIRASQNPAFRSIVALPTPMYLDLERRQQDWLPGRRESGSIVSRGSGTTRLGDSSTDSLSVAESLAEQAFSQFLAWRSERTDALKQEIILAAFRPTLEYRYQTYVPSAETRSEMLAEITTNEANFPEYLSSIGVSWERIKETVLPFFAFARDAVSHAPRRQDLEGDMTENTVKRFQDYSAVQPQIRHIQQLAGLLESYNAEVADQFARFKAYQDAINRFLKESGKRILFDGEGSLVVEIEKGQEQRRISALSSGERQLVVILTHLAFNEPAQSAKVLIIDEPELSLHLHWQDMFVEAILDSIADLQLIMATHSPAIIGSRVSNCIDVLEAQHGDRVSSRP